MTERLAAMLAEGYRELNEFENEVRAWAQREQRVRPNGERAAVLYGALSLLTEYRGVLTRIEQAAIVFSHHGEVIALLESIKEGYPLKTQQLSNRLTLGKGGWQ